MAILKPGLSQTFQLAPGETLSIVTDGASICRYGQLIPGTSVLGPGVSVTQNSAASVPDSGAPLDLCHLYGAGAPSAATGANQAQTASLYTDTTNAKLYINGGTKAVPSW